MRANRYPDLCELRMPRKLGFSAGTLRWLLRLSARTWKNSFRPATSLSAVIVSLALGLTYCRMARSANRVDRRRRHLLALACEALTMAEEYVEVAPSELLCNVLEDAERLRLEIRQLDANSTIPLTEGRVLTGLPYCPLQIREKAEKRVGRKRSNWTRGGVVGRRKASSTWVSTPGARSGSSASCCSSGMPAWS